MGALATMFQTSLQFHQDLAPQMILNNLLILRIN